MKNIHLLSFGLICMLCTMVVIAPTAHAAETVPGSACSVSGMIQHTGGPEQLPGQDLICDGSVWRILTEKITNGTILNQIGYDSGSCVAAKTGRMRYSSATDVWEYCDGSDPWLPFKKPLCLNDDTGECRLAVARNSGDPDFIAANIANGINVLGVVGTLQPIAYTHVATKVAVSADHSCFLTSANRAYCWGHVICATDASCGNAWGINIATPDWPSTQATSTIVVAPKEVFGGYTDWTAIYAGNSHSCGLRGGVAYCWGRNETGQLGTGNNTTLWVPGIVAGGYTDWTKLALGGISDYSTSPRYIDWHSCGVRSNGRLYCWGHNGDGQLGSNNNTAYNAPNEVNGAATDWASVAAGAWHSCALKTNGRLYCWGWGNNGALGTGNYTARLVPTQVSGNTTDWAFVAAGGQNSCAIKTTGRLYCWGFGGTGQLGNGTTTATQNTPVEVSGGYTDWVSVSAAGGADDFPTTSTDANTWGRACGARAGGALYCWGDSDGPLIGDGIFRRWGDDNYATTPMPVLLGMP